MKPKIKTQITQIISNITYTQDYSIQRENFLNFIVQVKTKVYGVQATMIKDLNTFLHRCTLHKFHMTDSQNKPDQIMSDNDQTAFCAFCSFLEVQTIAGYIHVTCIITTWL